MNLGFHNRSYIICYNIISIILYIYNIILYIIYYIISYIYIILYIHITACRHGAKLLRRKGQGEEMWNHFNKICSAGCLCQGDDSQSIPEAGDFVAPPQGFHDFSDPYTVSYIIARKVIWLRVRAPISCHLQTHIYTQVLTYRCKWVLPK